MTQGGPFSPRIFNVMVDTVVREWMRQKLGLEAAASGYRKELQRLMLIFYGDDAPLGIKGL